MPSVIMDEDQRSLMPPAYTVFIFFIYSNKTSHKQLPTQHPRRRPKHAKLHQRRSQRHRPGDHPRRPSLSRSPDHKCQQFLPRQSFLLLATILLALVVARAPCAPPHDFVLLGNKGWDVKNKSIRSSGMDT